MSQQLVCSQQVFFEVFQRTVFQNISASWVIPMPHCPFVLVDIFRQFVTDFVFIPLYDCKFPAFYGRPVIRKKMLICYYDRFCIIKSGLPDCMKNILVLYVAPERNGKEQAIKLYGKACIRPVLFFSISLQCA